MKIDQLSGETLQESLPYDLKGTRACAFLYGGCVQCKGSGNGRGKTVTEVSSLLILIK